MTIERWDELTDAEKRVVCDSIDFEDFKKMVYSNDPIILGILAKMIQFMMENAEIKPKMEVVRGYIDDGKNRQEVVDLVDAPQKLNIEVLKSIDWGKVDC